MTALLLLLILIPCLGAAACVIIPSTKERAIALTTFVTIALHAFLFILLAGVWIIKNNNYMIFNDNSIVKNMSFDFIVDFCFDKVSIIFLLMGDLLTLLIAVYSRFYLHKESGFKRYFLNILFFFIGYNVTVLAGNLGTLFIGWEILGLTSFLLISFYRERFLPVRNAIKVFSIYRLGDIGLVLAIWLNHHNWNEDFTFMKFKYFEMMNEYFQHTSFASMFIALMLLLPAFVKAAQFPFSAWLPRAMEGPTPSSALFYGSLSAHLGVFIIIRTWPFFVHQEGIRLFLFLIGLTSAILCSIIARVQSTAKSQIAYSTTSQIGIIMMELALGFENLALFHFVCNASLRAYQIIISPSLVSYRIQEKEKIRTESISLFNYLPLKWKNSLYTLAIKEFNLDQMMSRFVFKPLVYIGKQFDFITIRFGLMFFIPAYILGIFFLSTGTLLNTSIYHFMPYVFTGIGFIMVTKAFTERKDFESSWMLIIMNHFWISLSNSFNENFNNQHTIIYLSGIIVSGVVGFVCLRLIKRAEKKVDLDAYHGHIYEHPVLAIVFLTACLGLSGFPITPTFVGEDLIFSHIHQNQIPLALLTAICFMIDGLSVIRIYARIFLGPHDKQYHSIAYKSS